MPLCARSAHWCPDCHVFTPALAECYEAANEASKDFEVVFVSSDTDAAAQAAYMKELHGDWLRVPFDSPLRNALKKRYGCFAGKERPLWPEVERREGIPSLVVVGPTGSELVWTTDAIPAVEKQGPKAIASWAAYAWPSV